MNNALSPKNYCAWIKKKKKKGKTQMLNVGVNMDPNKYLVLKKKNGLFCFLRCKIVNLIFVFKFYS